MTTSREGAAFRPDLAMPLAVPVGWEADDEMDVEPAAEEAEEASFLDVPVLEGGREYAARALKVAKEYAARALGAARDLVRRVWAWVTRALRDRVPALAAPVAAALVLVACLASLASLAKLASWVALVCVAAGGCSAAVVLGPRLWARAAPPGSVLSRWYGPGDRLSNTPR